MGIKNAKKKIVRVFHSNIDKEDAQQALPTKWSR